MNAGFATAIWICTQSRVHQLLRWSHSLLRVDCMKFGWRRSKWKMEVKTWSENSLCPILRGWFRTVNWKVLFTWQMFACRGWTFNFAWVKKWVSIVPTRIWCQDTLKGLFGESRHHLVFFDYQEKFQINIFRFRFPTFNLLNLGAHVISWRTHHLICRARSHCYACLIWN